MSETPTLSISPIPLFALYLVINALCVYACRYSMTIISASEPPSLGGRLSELALGRMGPERVHAGGSCDFLLEGPPQTDGVIEVGPLQHIGSGCWDS